MKNFYKRLFPGFFLLAGIAVANVFFISSPVVYAANPIASYSFDNSQNPLADYSGTNTATCTVCPAYVATGGHLGSGAYNFSGSGNYIRLPNEQLFDFTTSLTVSFWMKVNGFTGNWEAFVTKGDSSWGAA